MVGFDKCFPSYFPVAGYDFFYVQHFVAIFRLPALEVLWQYAKVFMQWRGLQIHVDEDPAAPGVDLHLGQPELFILDVGEVPFARRPFEISIKVPGKGVIGAAEVLVVAAVVYQLSAAVQAGILEGPELA